MRTWERAGATATAVAAILAAGAVPASAAPHGRGAAEQSGPVVTKVRLLAGGEAAKVTFTLRCVRGQQFSLAAEVIQDSDPTDAVLDAYYTSTRLTNGTCTGRVQRFTVTTVPDRSGLFSSPDSRLVKGRAFETIGGDFDGVPDVTLGEVPVR